jgi:NAD(P)-dependent dehydrogenase (short-subunit alcohol dehydrogenase family)
MEDSEIADARYQFEVNLFGPARLTQLALPYMREKRAGKIVNVSSMGGRIYTPLGSWYHASKHAVEGWSDCLRIELAPFGIDVIVIEPGVIETEFGEVMVGPMLERSGESAYRDMAQAMAKASMAGSPPTLIAELIVKAIRARRPRTRYVAGKYARPLMLTRGLLGDRVFDRVVMQAVR